MNSLVAITIVFVVFAFGDLLATKKSIVSMLFTVSVIFNKKNPNMRCFNEFNLLSQSLQLPGF